MSPRLIANAAIRISILALVVVGASGCSEEQLFAACPFDNTILQNCDKGDGLGAQFTCVVESHPQCAEDICLSWKNSEPFCTRICSSGGGECPAGAVCAEYSKSLGKFFCIPESVIP